MFSTAYVLKDQPNIASIRIFSSLKRHIDQLEIIATMPSKSGRNCNFICEAWLGFQGNLTYLELWSQLYYTSLHSEQRLLDIFHRKKESLSILFKQILDWHPANLSLRAPKTQTNFQRKPVL